MNPGPNTSDRLFGKDPAAEPGVGGSYPLICHSVDTILTAEFIWDYWLRPGLRDLLTSMLGGDPDVARKCFLLAAGLHDVGKIIAFFQYQERLGAAPYAADLAKALGFPPSPFAIRSALRQKGQHPLRRHEFFSHRAVAQEWVDSMHRIDGVGWGRVHGKAANVGWLAVVVGGHHGFWRDSMVDSEPAASLAAHLLGGGWEVAQADLVDEICQLVGLSLADVPALSGPTPSVVVTCLTGMLILADWIASDDLMVRQGKELYSDDVLLGASPVKPQAWRDRRREALHRHALSCLGTLSSATAETVRAAVMDGQTPRPLQREAMTLGQSPGLWVAMYPTGDGKTKAALLRVAQNIDEGFIFGMPTMATTDAMERTLNGVGGRLGSEGFSLIKSHGMAPRPAPAAPPAAPPVAGTAPTEVRASTDQLEDDSCQEMTRQWYFTAIRKLVASYVVGTCDQVLSGALAARHIAFRLAGLANHHIILDEVHTYDHYQTELLLELLEWWGATQTRVTILSATLPAAHLQLMAQAYRQGATGHSNSPPIAVPQVFPGTVFVSADPHCSKDQAIVVRPPEGEVRALPRSVVDLVMVASPAERISEQLRWVRAMTQQHPHSPVAVMVNTVADCVEIAKQLLGDPAVTRSHEIFCLHSGLIQGHRLATEEHLVARLGEGAHECGFNSEDEQSRPLVVVGTQVIQASLDFDVDFLTTQLAPAPDVVQRMGRSWRFTSPGREARVGGAERSIHVVAVGERLSDGSERVSIRGAAPYLTAVLRRTYSALRAELERTGGRLDVVAFSQQWVDAAYNSDPQALVAEDCSIQQEAAREVVDVSAKKARAQIAKATLNTRSGLLRPVTGRKRPTWRDLVALTERADEEFMATRYVERESLRVIVLHSGGLAVYRDPRTKQFVQIPSAVDREGVASSSAEIRRDLLTCQISVLFRWQEKILAAVEKGLGGRPWQPEAYALRSTPPLDLRDLEGVRYDPVLGLVSEEES